MRVFELDPRVHTIFDAVAALGFRLERLAETPHRYFLKHPDGSFFQDLEYAMTPQELFDNLRMSGRIKVVE